MSRPTKAVWALVLVISVVMVWSSIEVCATNWNSHVRPTWEGGPVGTRGGAQLDQWLIHGGVVKAPRLIDTVRWWHGTWAGQVPFYRPLSSMFFWLDWRLFGNHEARYSAITIALHLCATLLFLVMSRDLFRRYRLPRPDLTAAFAGLLFVAGLGLIAQRAGMICSICGLWTDLCEPVTCICMCACVIAYLRARYGLSFLFLLLAFCSKESAVFTPLILCTLEWPALRERSARAVTFRRLAPFVAALPAYIAWRTWCLGTLTGHGYRMHTRLLQHFLPYTLGYVSISVSQQMWMALALGAAMLLPLAVIVERAHPRRWQVLAAVVATAVVLACASLGHTTGESGLAVRIAEGVLLYAYQFPSAAVICLTLAAFWYADRRVLAFGWGWLLLIRFASSIPAPCLFRDYLPEAGLALVLASGLAHIGARLADAESPMRIVRRATARSSHYKAR